MIEIKSLRDARTVLKTQREDLIMTPHAVSLKHKVDKESIYGFEKGTRTIYIETFFKLCKALGVKIYFEVE